MSADKMPKLPLIEGAVWGLWNDAGVSLVQRGSEDSHIARKGGHRLVTEAAAREYAAEQTRELVEACVEQIARLVHGPGARRENWLDYAEGHLDARHQAMEVLRAALIAKHKATGEQPHG